MIILLTIYLCGVLATFCTLISMVICQEMGDEETLEPSDYVIFAVFSIPSWLTLIAWFTGAYIALYNKRKKDANK